MKHDVLNDVLITIKSAELTGKEFCIVRPASKLVGNVLKVMQENSYIKSYELIENNRGGEFKIYLSKNINSCGVIKPRYAVKADTIDKYEQRYLPAQDFGILILTTNRGVISNYQAKELKIGGKLRAYVY